MVHIVKGDAVEEEEVLVGATAAHVHAAGAFIAALHSGEQLDGFDDVGFAEKHGDGLDLLHGNLDGTHLRRLARVDALGFHHHLFQLDAWMECIVAAGVAVQGDGVVQRYISHIGHPQQGLLSFQRQREPAVGVGGRPLSAARFEHGGTNQGFASGVVCHGAADGVLRQQHYRAEQ